MGLSGSHSGLAVSLILAKIATPYFGHNFAEIFWFFFQFLFREPVMFIGLENCLKLVLLNWSSPQILQLHFHPHQLHWSCHSPHCRWGSDPSPAAKLLIPRKKKYLETIRLRGREILYKGKDQMAWKQLWRPEGRQLSDNYNNNVFIRLSYNGLLL